MHWDQSMRFVLWKPIRPSLDRMNLISAGIIEGMRRSPPRRCCSTRTTPARPCKILCPKTGHKLTRPVVLHRHPDFSHPIQRLGRARIGPESRIFVHFLACRAGGRRELFSGSNLSATANLLSGAIKADTRFRVGICYINTHRMPRIHLNTLVTFDNILRGR